jgi:cysteine desulfurase
LAFSTGSACTSALQNPSHVLKAMQLSDEMEKGSVRLSLGKYTTDAEIDTTIQLLSATIKQLRKS